MTFIFQLINNNKYFKNTPQLDKKKQKSIFTFIYINLILNDLKYVHTVFFFFQRKKNKDDEIKKLKKNKKLWVKPFEIYK